MKKLSILIFVALILSACAAGINHNVAVVNNKPYLVETPVRNFFGLFQWSELSKYRDLETGVYISEPGRMKKYKKACEDKIRSEYPNARLNDIMQMRTACVKEQWVPLQDLNND